MSENNAVPLNDQRNYKTVSQNLFVCVKVSKEGKYMKLIEAHEFQFNGNTIPVQEHWQNSFVVPGTSQIIQRNFFEISEDALGKKIVAAVEVVEKITSCGRKVMLLNITKISGAKATSDLKFSEEGAGIELPDTKIKIVFQPR